MQTNCKPGDLAIVVTANNVSNIGLIVRVLHGHSSAGTLAIVGEGPVWSTECAIPMTWTIGNRLVRRRKGPIPDKYLQPIRGIDGPASTPANSRAPAVAQGSTT